VFPSDSASRYCFVICSIDLLLTSSEVEAISLFPFLFDWVLNHRDKNSHDSCDYC
jgi:hypothetical protein